MAWNESGNGKNPWDRGRNEGPPYLDKIVREWQQRLNSFLRGGRGGPRQTEAGSGQPGGPAATRMIVAVLVWPAVVSTLSTKQGGALSPALAIETTDPSSRAYALAIERSRININEVVRSSRRERADDNIVADLVVQHAARIP
jgi:membrane protease subunit HflK